LLCARIPGYDSGAGRFTQEDPIGLAGGLNLYGYGEGDPINNSDPFGLCIGNLPCPKGFVNAVAGFGDALSFGLTDLVRDAIGANDVVSKGSVAYLGGTAAGIGVGVALGAGAAGLAAAEGSAGRVVVGETMGRVRGAARQLGAETFETAATTAKQMWRENSTWLRKAMRDGKEVVDIGKDASRAVRSKFYQAEKAIIEARGYPTTTVVP
jgi:uncharacterized protein RhaS with RHS repeats